MKLTLESLVNEIGNTKSGKAAEENLVVLKDLLQESRIDRELLLSSKGLLSLLTTSLMKRNSCKTSKYIRNRFEAADSKLISMLTNWECDFGESFPVFQSWLAHQRKLGLSIPNTKQVTTAIGETNRMEIAIAEGEMVTVSKEISQSVANLERLLELFTPTLEEAFCEDNLRRHTTSDRLREELGENEELFRAAREQFNYLNKKLLDRIEMTSEKLLNLNPLSEVGLQGKREIARVKSSRVFQHFVVLLSCGKERGKRRRMEDTEFEEWF